MKGLFVNEWVKIKRSAWVMGVLLYLVLIIMLQAFFPGREENPVTKTGYGSVFGLISHFMGMDFYGAFAFLAAGLFGREFEGRVLNNIVGRGVKRRYYFAVKAACLMALSAALYIACLCIFGLLRTVIYGYNPGNFFYRDYWLKALVYNGGAVLLIFCYMSVSLLLIVLFRRSVPALICAVVINLMDSGLREGAVFSDIRIGGACAAAEKMWSAFVSDRILTGSFFAIFLPIICAGLLFLLLAGFLFEKTDLD